MGHVARANPVWRQLFPDTPSVVLFQGAQSYISPAWYPGRAEHGRVVPTWNYVVAHAFGTARVVEEPAWMQAMLQRLTNSQESGQAAPWQMGEAPADFMEKMMRAIVGIEIPIDRIDAKRKASQDEDVQDRFGTVQGLQSQPGEQSRQMAALVLNALTGEAPQDAGR
jgi:transcriptional regulator